MIRTSSTYIAVAAFCFILHNIAMIVADKAGAPLWLAVLLSFGLVAVSGYILHSIFTFRRSLALSGLAKYAAAMSANIPLAFIFTGFFYEWIGLPMALAAPLASICMLAINFLLSRWAIGASSGKMAENS